MAGRHSRNKGANFERRVANQLREAGFECRRVGEAQRSKVHGQECDLVAEDFVIECKHHAGYPNAVVAFNDACAKVENSVQTALAVIKADRMPELGVMLWTDLLEILAQNKRLRYLLENPCGRNTVSDGRGNL